MAGRRPFTPLALAVAVFLSATAAAFAQEPPDALPDTVADIPPIPQPPPSVRPPSWTQSIAESTDCLRGVDGNPAFAAIRPHMPTAENMGLAGINDRAKPTDRQREILVRYAEAAATCIPEFYGDESDSTGIAVAKLTIRLWREQTALLGRLALGDLTWGDYNRASMVIDRTVRMELAAIRKPPPAASGERQK